MKHILSAALLAGAVVSTVAHAADRQALPGRAAREAALLAVLPRNPPVPVDDALVTQFIHDNPGKETIIRQALTEEAACNNTAITQFNNRINQHLVHNLSDNSLDLLTRLYTGPDHLRLDALTNKETLTGDEQAELEKLVETYHLREASKIIDDDVQKSSLVTTLGLVQETCRDNRDHTLSGDDITTLDARLATAAFNYTGAPGQLDEIKALLAKGAHPHADSGHKILLGFTTGTSALTNAVSGGHADLVRLFLQQPVDLEIPSAGEETLLMLAADQTNMETDNLPAYRDIIRQLIAAGAKVNTIDTLRGATAMSDALHTNPDNVTVKILLDAHADATHKNTRGFTYLMGVAASRLDLSKLLINAGADPYAVSTVGSTALDFVCDRSPGHNGQPDPTAADRIALFLKPGTNIDTHPPQQEAWPISTPLGEALLVTESNHDCIRALIAAGSSGDAPAFPDKYISENPEHKETVRQYLHDLVYNSKDRLTFPQPYLEFLKSLNLLD